MHKKVILQKQTEISDGMGSAGTISYTDKCSFKADLQPLSGREIVFTDKNTVFSNYRLFVQLSKIEKPYQSELKEKNRVKIGSKYYNIKLVKDYGAHWEIDLLEMI